MVPNKALSYSTGRPAESIPSWHVFDSHQKRATNMAARCGQFKKRDARRSGKLLGYVTVDSMMSNILKTGVPGCDRAKLHRLFAGLLTTQPVTLTALRSHKVPPHTPIRFRSCTTGPK